MDEDARKEDSLQAAIQQETLSLPGPPPTGADEGDLEGVFEAHQAQVLRAAYRITGNPADAEDVLQTVFLRLMRRPEPLGPAETLAPYLHRAAVNAALDTLRSRRRARAVPLEDEEGATNARAAVEDPRPGPEAAQRGRELRAGLRAAIATLSPRAAEVFVLRFIEGLGNKEIARMLGTSQTAIGVTLHRTRTQLREELAGLLGDRT